MYMSVYSLDFSADMIERIDDMPDRLDRADYES